MKYGDTERFKYLYCEWGNRKSKEKLIWTHFKNGRRCTSEGTFKLQSRRTQRNVKTKGKVETRITSKTEQGGWRHPFRKVRRSRWIKLGEFNIILNGKLGQAVTDFYIVFGTCPIPLSTWILNILAANVRGFPQFLWENSGTVNSRHWNKLRSLSA
jgi:hypothetical protein